MPDTKRTPSAGKPLQDSRRKLSLVLAAARMGLWEWDLQNDLVFWSPECSGIIGEVAPGSFTGILQSQDRDRVLAAARRALADGTVFAAEFRITSRDGAVRWVSTRGEAGCEHDANARCLFGTIQDITDRKEVEERLRESESTFTSLAGQSLVGIYIVQDGIFRYVNPRFADMLGCPGEEIVDRMRPQDVAAPEDREVVEANLPNGHTPVSAETHCEFRLRRKNGEPMSAELFRSPTVYRGRPATIGLILDISEKTKLEQQLRQAQKMEAVGQLTSGIAHDFNNILCAMIGFATLLRSRACLDDTARVYADQILGGADRAANLIRSLLTFSRKQICDLRPVDLNELIGRVEKLLYWVIGEDIELRTTLAPDQLKLNADPGQIEQILMNLATNAADAMPQGGVLSIETALVNRDPQGRAADDWQERSIMISVSDTGSGMDEKTREKIFEPFFTTKDLGRGTGLGLSMVYGVIKQHGGSIHCTSRPGEGTNFRIYLPVLTPAHPFRPETETTFVQPEECLHGAETVLLAEDDAAMLSFVRTTLETFGYQVIEARSGKEAIELFLQHKSRIQIVVADVIMPGMSGAELQNTVRKDSPEMPILFMSGYPTDTVYRKSLLDTEAEIVSKPFQPNVLLRRVRLLLDRGKHAKIRTHCLNSQDHAQGIAEPVPSV